MCKERLDIHIHPAGQRFAVINDAGGWRRLKHVLGSQPVVRIVMEATSRYHRAAHRSLHAAGLAVAIVNPLRARLFAEAMGTLANPVLSLSKGRMRSMHGCWRSWPSASILR